MKKLFALYIILVVFTGLLFSQSETKVTVAVLDFDGKGVAESEASILSDRFRSELVKTDAVKVVERGQMNTILEEIGFQQSGCTTSECLVEIGQVLNVQKMISATVGKFGNVYTIDLRMIDVGTAQIISTISEDHEGEMADLLKLMKNMAQRMASNLSGKEIKSADEDSGNFWLWTTVGTVAVGAAVAFLVGGSDNGNGNSSANLPLPPAKP
jgi:TolB-like protein